MVDEKKRFRLPKEFAIKWVEALRSGNYKQGMSLLHNEEKDTYCCLGVACHIVGADYRKADAGWIDSFAFSSSELNKLPTELQGDDDGQEEATLYSVLANMNDRGITFERIATWIEKNVELYENI